MKKLFVLFLLFTTPVWGYVLQWDESDNAEGYVVSWAPLSTPVTVTLADRQTIYQCPPCPQMQALRLSPEDAINDVDTGTNTSLDLNTLPLEDGVRYAFQVFAYTGSPKSYSSPSDTIHWTKQETQIVEMPSTPKEIIFRFP